MIGSAFRLNIQVANCLVRIFHILPVGIAHAYLDNHSRLVYGLDPETIANCIVIRNRPQPRTIPMDGEVEGLTDPFRNLDVWLVCEVVLMIINFLVFINFELG